MSQIGLMNKRQTSSTPTVADLKPGQIFSLYGEEDREENIMTVTGEVKVIGAYVQVPVAGRVLPFQALATSTVKFWKKS